ncbi:MAG: TlpA disulfide reductase family protein [Nitrospinota bacterium]
MKIGGFPSLVLVALLATAAPPGSLAAAAANDLSQAARRLALWAPARAGQVVRFEALDVEGRATRSADYRGRVLLVEFFATCCCLTCPDELPALARLHRKYRDAGLAVVLVSVDSYPTEVVRGYLKALNIRLRAIHDEDGRLYSLFGVETLPTTILLDREGRWAARSGVMRAEGDAAPLDGRSAQAVIGALLQGERLPLAPDPDRMEGPEHNRRVEPARLDRLREGTKPGDLEKFWRQKE